MLLAAALLSFALHDPTDAIIILGIVLVSGLLGFWQERGAATAIERLLATVEVKAKVLRDGREIETAVEKLVAGDVVLLAAGSSIPADCLLLAGRDLFVDEAALTGESFPVEKSSGVTSADAPLSRRSSKHTKRIRRTSSWTVAVSIECPSVHGDSKQRFFG